MKQVERVARAIFKADSAVMTADRQLMWADHKDDWMAMAQAAIAAMWTPFDAEDESTWPEESGAYITKFEDGRYSDNAWNKAILVKGQRKMVNCWGLGEVTHYQEITGESDE